MKIAIIDKDQFAALLKYGELYLPMYSYWTLYDYSNVEDALGHILTNGNPVEFASQYIIVLYESEENDSPLRFSSVKELIATNAESRRLFTTQFRDDLIIEHERYAHVFDEYLNVGFQKERILKGIKTFRSLCGLSIDADFSEDVEIVFRGINNRLMYRHHYELPEEERNHPYSLMIAYDRYSPYPKGWKGYFCDVIETYCYHAKPDLKYTESIAQNTKVYPIIEALGPKANSLTIYEAIKNEPFAQQCDKFFEKDGRLLVPYIFFILRDKFRNSDSFYAQSELIDSIQKVFPEAFDTAATFVGGFFGYEKFYEDYYTSLNLPIFKSSQAKDGTVYVEPQPAVEPTFTQIEPLDEDKLIEENSDVALGANSSMRPQGVIGNTLFGGEEDTSDSYSELYGKLFQFIELNMKPGVNKRQLQHSLYGYKTDEEKLQEIEGLLLSPKFKKEKFKEYFGFKSCPQKELEKLRSLYQNAINQ